MDAEKVGLLVVAAILTFASALYWGWRSEVKERDRKREERETYFVDQLSGLAAQVYSLRSDVQALEKQIQPVWKGIQDVIVERLTHPSPQFEEMDRLLAELSAGTLTQERRTRLRQLVRERMVSDDPEVSAAERAVAGIAEQVMIEVLIEQAAAEHPPEV
jgi:hypothetical protein